MLLAQERGRVQRIEKALKALATGNKLQETSGNREFHNLLRSGLRIYEDVVHRCRKTGQKPGGKEFSKLRDLAGRALDELGGQDSPAAVSLRSYDHEKYGPFLGVSDEGSATAAVRDAALSSPKAEVLGEASPLAVGVSLDAERLAAAGEVAVGPDEYREIRLGCIGSILTSTNVGTRLNLRYFKQRPRIDISTGHLEDVLATACDQAKGILEPFLHTPDGTPRALTVFLHFEKGTRRERRLEILRHLKAAFSAGEFCDPEIHELGILTLVRRGWIGVKAAQAAIDLAKSAKLSQVAIEGVVRREAGTRISMPDLLNFFSADQTEELLSYAHSRQVQVTPWYLVDPETVARNVWAPLQVARNMGLELGKYGLFPLTLQQSEIVMLKVQGWFRDWTAAPALYVDFPIVDSTRVYTESCISKGIERWLQVANRTGIPVVLIDTADKSKGRRLLKKSPSDRVGILHREEIAEIDDCARRLGIKALWAGGLTIPQTYEMGRLQVFGIYVTTSVSSARPVAGAYKWDPMLPSQKEPTVEGVARAKLLLESGFLATRLADLRHPVEASQIDQQAKTFIKALVRKRGYDKDHCAREQTALRHLAMQGWKVVFGDE